MVIGWLHDDMGMIGGAELSSDALRAAAPDWVDGTIYCPPHKRPPKVDAFVVQNCILYGKQWISALQRVPVIKGNRDIWYAGSITLRRWLLRNAKLLTFNSPMAEQAFGKSYTAPVEIMPPPLVLDAFRAAARPESEREGAVFVGRIEPGKGVHRAIDWALDNNIPLDVYGGIAVPYVDWSEGEGLVRYCGEAPYAAIPEIMGRAKYFVLLPTRVEPFGRTVGEAWAAGCELIVNEHVGAMWWIENRPEDVGRGAEMFWNAAAEVLR